MLRRTLTLTIAAAVSALALSGVVAPAQASPEAAPAHHSRPVLPDRIELPDGFLPEGITTGFGPYAWLGSRADGDIYRANLLTGEGKVVSEGPGTPSVGLKIDRRGRLFVAGGTSGEARVIDARTGDVLATYQLGEETSFVNDVVLTKRAAWFTDSLRAVLYKLPLGRHGALPDAAQTLELSGDWEQAEGFNANGITATPDGRGLLVVNTTTGVLHRVDPRTGRTTAVDLGGASLPAGDGMLLLGRTLYVAQNQLDRVTVVRLNRSGTAGTVVDELISDDFDAPTTIALFAGALYLPNARFSEPQEPTTEFWITRLPLHRAGAW